MSRSERLLQLLQVLRRYRRAVAGQVLADELGVSLRTLYRDIASLQAQGADIEGEPGIGYLLRPGYMLPPLMFSAEEIEALVLGTRLVANRADAALALAARDALAKITEVLPEELRDSLRNSALLAGPSNVSPGGLPASGPPAAGPPQERVDLKYLREAIRSEQRLTIAYRDEQGRSSEREIWPFALAFFDGARVLVAWCTLRDDFRHFRTDRMELVDRPADGRYPKRRLQLLKAWRQKNGIPERML